MIKNLGFMQGRLSNQINGAIQAFPWDTWRDEFEIASEIGFCCMEWTLDAEGLLENPFLTRAGQDEIIKLSTTHKVKIPSVTADCFMQEPFWKSNEGNYRTRLKKDFIAVVRACEMLKVGILVVPLVDNGSVSSAGEQELLCDFLLDIIPELRRSKVQIAFETDFAPEKNNTFINNLPKGCYGINYDTGNSAALGFDPKSELLILSKTIINVHLKDRERFGDTVPLGEGDTDFKEVFRQLKRYNYCGNLILQTARAIDGDHLGALLSNRRFISEIWEQVCC